MKIVFFGTPQFAAQTLQFLIAQEGVEVVAVVTQPPRPKGRSSRPVPSAVAEVALRHHIPLLQPEKASAPKVAEQLQQFQAHLFVVVAYGEILRKQLLDMPILGCINLHASLLPKYRGAAPIQRCLMNGESESGVTIMHMVKELDAGDMIKVVKAPINDDTSLKGLEETLCEIGSQALLDVIRDFENGKIDRVPQEHQKATYAAKITPEECQIHWDRSAREIHNLIRGVNPRPGAWCQILIDKKPHRLKIFLSKIVKQNHSTAPGSLLKYAGDQLIVTCGEDALQIIELQLEGKKAVAAAEFIRGFPPEVICF